MDFTTDWEKMRFFLNLLKKNFLNHMNMYLKEYIATARIVAKADNPNFDIEQKFIKHVDSLEGRDLMYFFNSGLHGIKFPDQNLEYYYVLQKMEGDAITAFLADNKR